VTVDPTPSGGEAETIARAVVVAVGVWWLGRSVAPRLGHLRFWALIVASLAGGAVASLLARPGLFGYASMSLVGGLGAAYSIGRRRGRGRSVAHPFSGNMGYGVFFLGWLAINALSADSGALVALAGGAVVGAPVAWWMEDQRNRRVGAAAGFGVAVALFGAGAVAAGVSTVPAPSFAALEAIDDFSFVDPTSAPAGWVTVSVWEERFDTGDFHSYRLRCTPTQLVEDISYGGLADPTVPCAWLADPANSRTVRATSPCQAGSDLIWRVMVSGDYQGERVGIDVQGSDDREVCTTPVARSVVDAFAPT
jgi:hypothetical protein